MKKRPNFPSIKGFEFFPEGKLLHQVVDFDCQLGIAYERCIGYTKAPHTHDRFTISFARGSSRSEFRFTNLKMKQVIDQSTIHFMPKDILHEQYARSVIYDTFAIFPDDALLMEAMQEADLNASEQKDILQVPRKLKRTPYIDDLVDRYFLSRVIRREKKQARRLELDLLVGVFTTAFKRDSRESKREESTKDVAITRAIEFIEGHLFDKLDARSIAKAAGVSQATLFRQFADGLSLTPAAYIRSRRMDEARALLQKGDYLVSDVCHLVGYEDLSAFSKAFTQHFGQPPSSFLKSGNR